MEHQPFKDVFPIENWDFPMSCEFFWGVPFLQLTAPPWKLVLGRPCSFLGPHPFSGAKVVILLYFFWSYECFVRHQIERCFSANLFFLFQDWTSWAILCLVLCKNRHLYPLVLFLLGCFWQGGLWGLLRHRKPRIWDCDLQGVLGGSTDYPRMQLYKFHHFKIYETS